MAGLISIHDNRKEYVVACFSFSLAAIAQTHYIHVYMHSFLIFFLQGPKMEDSVMHNEKVQEKPLLLTDSFSYDIVYVAIDF